MKITNEKLKKIIQEELENVLNEFVDEQPEDQKEEDPLNFAGDSKLHKDMTDFGTAVQKQGGSKKADKATQNLNIQAILKAVFTNPAKKAAAFKYVQELMKQKPE